MKYCLDYHPNNLNKYLDKIDEIRFFMQESKKISIEKIQDIIEKYPNATFIFCGAFEIINGFWLEVFKTFRAYNHYNFKVEIVLDNKKFYVSEELKKIIEELKENEIKYYFSCNTNDWETLYLQLKEGVSDVYITEALGFELDSVSKIVHNYGAEIRVYPNICQYHCSQFNRLYSFFIRPEDVDFYDKNNYIDIFDFSYCMNKDMQCIDETLYKIYAIDKKWYGNLKELIQDLWITFDNRNVIDIFGPARATCGRRCLKGVNCNICSRVQDIAAKVGQKEDSFKKEV